jgi:hypothetical protein
VEESQLVREWVEQGIEQGIEQGKTIGLEQGKTIGLEQGKTMGKEEGRVETLRENIRRLLPRLFEVPVPPTVEAALRAQVDAEVLSRWLDLALSAASMDAFCTAIGAGPQT